MELLKFDEIFNDEDVSNYDLFIGKLKQLKENGHTTKEILGLVYQYYQKYVTYNYDQLQIVKINNPSLHPEMAEIAKKYPSRLSTTENAEEIKQGIIKYLNDVFMKLEGRTLTQRTIDKAFEIFGTVVHHEAVDIIKYEGKPFEKKVHKDAYDEIMGFEIGWIPSFGPVYENGMLREGVCGEYANGFEKRVCEDLGIKHMPVKGKGTTSHAWSLIYLPEEQRWVHFDMTMVKFYQDGWIKEHEPYTEQDWITATTEEIFKMQPTREIQLINGKEGAKFPIAKNNYEELNISEFDNTILPEKIGGTTIDVPVEEKEKAHARVSIDIKEHELEENQREGVSRDGE